MQVFTNYSNKMLENDIIKMLFLLQHL